MGTHGCGSVGPTYRPAEIQANITYIVEFTSNSTNTFIDNFAEDVENLRHTPFHLTALHAASGYPHPGAV